MIPDGRNKRNYNTGKEITSKRSKRRKREAIRRSSQRRMEVEAKVWKNSAGGVGLSVVG